MRTVYLDLETTGLDPAKDEILEIGILADSGEVLLDSLVRPERHREWPEAQKINGISPADVAEAPTLTGIRPRIVEAVAGALVVIYNAPFDAGFLVQELVGAADIQCAMRPFAEVYGEWNNRYGNWRWQKLGVAAAYVGFQWSGSAHRAIHDCQATRAIWHYLTDPAERARIDAIRLDESAHKEAAIELRMLEWRIAEERQVRELIVSRSLFECLGLREPKKLTAADQDAITRAFTGCTLAVWKIWQQFQDLPVYRQRAAIPSHLIGSSGLRERPVWMRDLLVPAGLYVSRSGSQATLLYDSREADRLVESGPIRYEAFAEVPEGLVTKTQYKKLRRTDPEQAGLAPVAEVRLRSRGGRVYTPLYRLEWVDVDPNSNEGDSI
jgi:DNA polymerase III subunit epsilon